MQCIPCWAQSEKSQLFTPCDAYQLTRTELDPLWDIRFTYTNCYNQQMEIGLSPLSGGMQTTVCSMDIPIGYSTHPLGGGFTISKFGDCEDNTPKLGCDKELSYNGGQSFPSTNEIILGSGTGVVTLSYDSYNIPDKFIVKYGGITVIDTGYRGDAAYMGDLSFQLTRRGLPIEPIVGPGSGTASFIKSTPSPLIAYVEVWAPLGNTAWDLTVGCPK